MSARPHEAVGFDPGSRAFVLDPYPVFDALRAVGRPLWHEELGLWLAFGHADADAVLRDRRLGRVYQPREPQDAWDTFNWLHADSILDSEPPKHSRLRSLVAKAFARGHVDRLRPRVRELADGLLDQAGSTFDVIADYAEPLPVMVIAELLGIPATDQALLRPWSQAIVKMYEYDRTSEQEALAIEAGAEFSEYVASLARTRRERPGDDLVSHLALVEDGGQRLSERELVATCVLLLNAGHEASVNAFGNGMVALLGSPDALQQLRTDPWGHAATAVEEFLRFDSPLHLFERTAKQDTEIGGIAIAQGEKIAALLGSANRDPSVFDRAAVLDITRDPNAHIGFGSGIHFCLGAPLARLELQISLPLLIERFPRLALGEQPVLRKTFVLRGYERVLVTQAEARGLRMDAE